jgi:hypothetical protein
MMDNKIQMETIFEMVQSKNQASLANFKCW